MPFKLQKQQFDHRQRTAGLWIFMAALLVRLVYFAWSQSSPFLYQLSTDEAFYVDYARHIVAGKTFAYANFMDPLLAYLLAIPLHLTDNLHLVRLGFVLLDSVNAWLVYLICLCLLGNRNAALMAGVLYVFYSLAVIYSVFINKSTLVIFFLLAITYGFLSGFCTLKYRNFIGAGVLTVLLVFVGASYVLLVPVYICILLAVAEWRRFAMYFIAGVMLVVIMHLAYFQWIGENKSLLPTNGGTVFYIANHTGNMQGTHIAPGFVAESTPVGIYQAFKQQALRESPSLADDKQISAFWYKKTIAENLAHPEIGWQRLQQKLQWLLSNNEISQNYYLPFIEQKTLHNLPLLSFALVLGFGLAGLTLVPLTDKRWLFIFLPIAVVVFTCTLFFVADRMRLPMVPFLIVGCACWARAEQASYQRLVVAIALAIVLTGSSYRLAANNQKAVSTQDEYNLAIVMFKSNMFVEAEALVDGILQRETTARYLFLKAVIESAKGQCDKALTRYDMIDQLQPGYPGVAANRQWCIDVMQHRQVKP